MNFDDPYWCNNRPRPPNGQLAAYQDGWTTDGRRRVISMPFFSNTEVCRYDNPTTDIRCKGCRYGHES